MSAKILVLNLGILFLQKILNLGKFGGADFKYGKGNSKFQS